MQPPHVHLLLVVLCIQGHAIVASEPQCPTGQQLVEYPLINSASYGGTFTTDYSGASLLNLGTFDGIRAVYKSGYVSCDRNLHSVAEGSMFAWQSCQLRHGVNVQGKAFEMQLDGTYVYEQPGWSRPPSGCSSMEGDGSPNVNGDLYCTGQFTVHPGSTVRVGWYESMRQTSLGDNSGTIVIDLIGLRCDHDPSWCAPGKTFSGKEEPGCVPCQVDTYKNSWGAQECDACPDGLVAPSNSTVCVHPEPDPGFPPILALPSPAAISLPTPAIVGIPCAIDVRLFNFGRANMTSGASVQISANQWGVTYGGWEPIGVLPYDALATGQSAVRTLTHVFGSRALSCVEAVVVDMHDDSNADDSNDRAQLNVNIVHAGASYDVWVPFGNAADEDVVVTGTRLLCVTGNGTLGDCEESMSEAPQLLGAPGQTSAMGDELRANSEVVARVAIPVVPDEGLRVVVEAQMGGEVMQAEIEVVRSSVEAMLNEAQVCCVRSVKTRALLEAMAADALEAFEGGRCKQTLKLLQLLVQKAILVECDLSDEEVSCVERMLLRMVDAGIMAVRELMEGGSGDGANLAFLQEAHFFRRAGLYEAALLEAAKAC